MVLNFDLSLTRSPNDRHFEAILITLLQGLRMALILQSFLEVSWNAMQSLSVL